MAAGHSKIGGEISGNRGLTGAAFRIQNQNSLHIDRWIAVVAGADRVQRINLQ
jgi:hypothetical protein